MDFSAAWQIDIRYARSRFSISARTYLANLGMLASRLGSQALQPTSLHAENGYSSLLT
jgi:hypothetical protein